MQKQDCPDLFARNIRYFVTDCVAERGLSRCTVSAYESDLTDFAEYLKERKVPSFAEVARDMILDYLGDLGDIEGRESTTLARRLVSIKMLFRFLAAEKMIPADVTAVMDSPRLWRMLPDFLTEDEVTRLLEAYPNGGNDPLLLRNRVILELLYASGLRVSELAKLPIAKISFDDELVTVVGKGSKTRVVPVGRTALRLLKKYLENARPGLAKNATEQTVFLSRNGRPLNREWIWRIVTEAGRIAGIEKNIHPHTLRHSFASHLLAHGADLRVIQEMLGHADIGTTEIYTHIEQNRLASIHQRFHPRK